VPALIVRPRNLMNVSSLEGVFLSDTRVSKAGLATGISLRKANRVVYVKAGDTGPDDVMGIALLRISVFLFWASGVLAAPRIQFAPSEAVCANRRRKYLF